MWRILMKKLLLTGLACALLVGCAQEPLKKQTSSGKPETEFPNKTVDQVINGITEYCNDKGFVVEEQNKNYVVCAKEDEGAQGFFTQLAIGNAYSTTPQNKLRFSVSKKGNGSKVWVNAWSETQMAMGQVNKMPFEGNKAQNQMQDMLDLLLPQYVNKQ